MELRKNVSDRELAKPIIALATNFIENAGIAKSNTAVEFAARIINIEPTWTLPDVINFFEFIMNNQHDERLKVYGDKLPVLRLLEMVHVYEEAKSIERENIIAEEKNSYLSSSKRESSGISVKAMMGKALEEVHMKNDGKKVYDTPADENFFNPEI